MFANAAAIKLKIGNKDKPDIFSICLSFQQSRTNIPKESNAKSENNLGMAHSEVCSPIEIDSKAGAKYFVIFTGQQSRWTVFHPIKRNSDVFVCFQDFLALAERRTGQKLKI